MLIGHWYLDEFGNRTREIKALDAEKGNPRACFGPMPYTVAIIARAIPAAIRPYSMAVAPPGSGIRTAPPADSLH